MADGYKVNTLDELKGHFDIESVVKYFYQGTLQRWLKARKCDNEIAQVEKLSRLDRDLDKKLCAVFGVNYKPGRNIPSWIVEIMNRLKQITDDKNLLKQIEQELIDKKAHVAFNQTELDNHVKNFNKIYLASSEFVIPLNMTGKTYIGVGERAVAVIKPDKYGKPVDIDRLNIKLESIRIEGSVEGGGSELDEIVRLINSGTTKGSYMYKMQVLKKKYIELKDSKSLRKLGDLYKKIPEGLMAEDCYREADRIDKPPKPPITNPQPTEPKPNTPPEHFKNRFKEIETLFDKPRKSNAGIKKALDELEKMVAVQRYRNEMEWIAYYYVRIHEDKKAKECLDKAKTFPQYSPQPTPPPSPKPKPKPSTPTTLFIEDKDTGKSQFTVEFGWKGKKEGIIFTSEKKVPMIAGTFLLGENNKLTRQEDFVYGGDKHPSGCVQRTYNSDNGIQIKIDLNKIPEYVTGIAFFLSTKNSGQTFSDLSEAYIRIFGEHGIKYTLDYDHDKNIKNATVVFMAVLERQEYDWHFGIMANGYNMGLRDVFEFFNENNDDDLPIDDSPQPSGKPNAKTETKIRNRKGIHARPASVFVEKASSFKSAIQVEARGKSVDAKSILMLMSLGLVYGTPITLKAWGPDAFEAVNELRKLIESGCGEN